LWLLIPRDDPIDPINGDSQRLKSGKSIGRFVTMTATNVSRTAQEPASKAPWTGSVTRSATRNVAAMTTKRPQEKRAMRAIFFLSGMEVLKSMGMGMEMR
jgi:hypothetical protein